MCPSFTITFNCGFICEHLFFVQNKTNKKLMDFRIFFCAFLKYDANQKIFYTTFEILIIHKPSLAIFLICPYRSILFLGIHFPSIFLGGEFVKFWSRFDYLEKLLSNKHSFIIFVMKLCTERKKNFEHVFCQPSIYSIPYLSLCSPSLCTLPSPFSLNLTYSLSTFLIPSKPSSFPLNLPHTLLTFLIPSKPSSFLLNLPHSLLTFPSQPSLFSLNLPYSL